MSFDGQIFDKKITVREEGSLTPKEVEIVPGGTADTKTTVVSSQTTNKTLTLPDLNDTLVGLAGTQTLTNKTLVVANNTITTAASGIITSTELNAVIAEVAGDLATLASDIAEVGADLQTHIDDPTGAHAATAISFSDVTYPGVSNVSEALLAVQTSSGVTQQELEDHIIDTETHGATGAIVGTTNTQTLTNKTLVVANNTITTAASGGLIATELNAALAELEAEIVQTASDADSALQAHITDATGAHAATAISNLPSGNLSSINVQAALNELQGDIDNNATNITGVSNSLSAHISDATDAHDASAISVIPTGNLGADDVQEALVELQGDIDTHVAATAAHGATGAVVGTTNTQTLTNKTFGNATTFAQLTTPSTPAAGFNVIYPKADGNFYNLNSAGVELPLGSGGGGGGTKNYLASVNGVNGNGNFELGNTTKWNLFSTTMTGKIPTGTIAAPGGTIDSFTAISSNVLAGTYSGQINASAAISPGDGVISDAFTLDAEDVAKPFSASFYYQALGLATPGTSSNSFAVYLYDVANSAWVQPSNVYGINQSTNIGKWAGEFQTSSNATTYQIALICITVTSGLPVELRVDDFSVGPSVYNQGTPVTDWQDYTLTVGATTTPPTQGSGATKNARWRRIGDSMEITFNYYQTAAGSTGSGTYLFPIPAGFTIDSTKIALTTAANGNGGTVLGNSIVNDISVGASNFSLQGQVFGYSTTQLYIVSSNSAAGQSVIMSSSSQVNFGDTICNVSFKVTVPILGWSSSVQMSDSADTRVVDFVGNTITTQAVTANVTNINLNSIKDSHGAWTGSTYVIPVPGDYSFSGFMSVTVAAAYDIDLYVNAAMAYKFLRGEGSGNSIGSVVVPNLKAGDIVSFRSGASQTITSSLTRTISITKISGPSAIAESERIACRYTNTAGTVVTTSYALIPFATKDYDTHGAFSAGIFTAPAAGEYQVILCLIGTTAGSPETIVALYKNGSHYSRLADNGPSNGSTGLHGSDTVMLLAGETLGIYSFASSNNTLSAVAGLNHVTFRRVK